MKWALTQVTNELRYWKMDQANGSAELKYNGRAQSFRLTASDKRLFFVERVGLLQNKFLVRTEYSQVTGEVHPGKNRYAGVATIENKRFNYSFTEHSLELSAKGQRITLSIEGDEVSKLATPELCALLFSTLRVTNKHSAQLEVA